jgi:hypothetical protein
MSEEGYKYHKLLKTSPGPSGLVYNAKESKASNN